MKITDKDWTRMMDLVLTGKDGAGTAKVIKDKNKATLRFVAGLKLDNNWFTYSEVCKNFYGAFSEFGNKALELGATLDEIKTTYLENAVPTQYSEKIIKLSKKKLKNRFVGDLSKKVLEAGFDINFLPHTGDAITRAGKDAMSRNGRKWTIGYKTEISRGSKTMKLTFDAITDEGNGPTSYIIISKESDELFKGYSDFQGMSKAGFVHGVLNKLISME